jgi:hypothetical protein
MMNKTKLGVSYFCFECEHHWYEDNTDCPECGSTDVLDEADDYIMHDADIEVGLEDYMSLDNE